MSLWKIIFLASLGFILIFLMIYILIVEFFIKKRKSSQVKDTFIARLDVFNRRFLIEKLPKMNKKIIKEINLQKLNKFSLITNLFSKNIAKKFAEILDRLEKGSESEEFIFDDISIYKKNEMARYYFYFYKMEDSTEYLFKFNYIIKSKSDYIVNPIKEISKYEIIKNNKKIIGFVAFSMQKNINYSLKRFLKLLRFNKKITYIYYLKYNNLLILLIFKNTVRQVKRVIYKIEKQVEKNYFANEFKYLYNGSAVVISRYILSIKEINQTIKILNFLVMDSIQNNQQFLFAIPQIISKNFKSYSDNSKKFNEIIINKSFQMKHFDIVDITNNNKIGNYVFPYIGKIKTAIYDWLMSSHQNQIELLNAFAEKMLFQVTKNTIMIDVDDIWLANNIDKIINKNIILVIKFNLLNEKLQINLMNKLNEQKITFALDVKSYNQGTDYILQSIKPPCVLIDDNFWTQDKNLTSNTLVELISLSSLLMRNNIKIIYKNPSLLLDKKIHKEIGLKYYFVT